MIGRVLLNQFRVDEFIAAGGMGAVYRVQDLKRNAPLAMKVLHDDLADDPTIFQRFQREARALQGLAHPHIVPFYGLYTMDETVFLLERFIDGPTLKKVIHSRAGQPFPVSEALAILQSVTAALGYAHAHGVVHCDVKPGNIMIDRGGNVYLTDFGIARHAASTITSLGFVGSPTYMAPEQIREQPVTPATDVYALGVLAYEMLTGRRPFTGEEDGSKDISTGRAARTLFAHLNLAPADPRLLNPEIPEPLSHVILQALQKDPSDRYQTTKRFYEDACSTVGQTDVNLQGIFALPNTLLPADHLDRHSGSVSAQGDVEAPGVKFRNLLIVGSAVVGLIAVVLIAVNSGLTRAAPTSRAGGGTSVAAVFNATPGPSSNPNILEPTVPTTRPPSPTFTTRPTKTSVPATSTPVPATNTPKPPDPYFAASENMYCRDGPGSGFEAHTTILSGQVLPVLAKSLDDDWLLVGIDNPATRTKCCWVGGEGKLNVDIAGILQINYRPDRIECEIN